MPLVDWSTVQLKYQPKNDAYPIPGDELSDVDFVTALYRNILLSNEPESGEGHQHWQSKLKNGFKRSQIHAFFIHTAKTDNAKNAAPQDFGSVLDNTGRKRALMLCKESIGDIMMMTSLFESFHQEYPETDLYVMTDEKYHEILEGNPHVHKILAYQPAFENEMTSLGAGQPTAYFDYTFLPGIQTQAKLGYLGRNTPAFSLDL